MRGLVRPFADFFCLGYAGCEAAQRIPLEHAVGKGARGGATRALLRLVLPPGVAQDFVRGLYHRLAQSGNLDPADALQVEESHPGLCHRSPRGDDPVVPHDESVALRAEVLLDTLALVVVVAEAFPVVVRDALEKGRRVLGEALEPLLEAGHRGRSTSVVMDNSSNIRPRLVDAAVNYISSYVGVGAARDDKALGRHLFTVCTDLARSEGAWF